MEIESICHWRIKLVLFFDGLFLDFFWKMILGLGLKWPGNIDCVCKLARYWLLFYNRPHGLKPLAVENVNFIFPPITCLIIQGSTQWNLKECFIVYKAG